MIFSKDQSDKQLAILIDIISFGMKPAGNSYPKHLFKDMNFSIGFLLKPEIYARPRHPPTTQPD